MPDLQDLVRLVRGPVPEKPLPAIWDYFPCHAGAVGGVDNFLDYYLDVEMNLHLQLKLIDLLPEALILPGVFPDLGVIVEGSAFGGRMVWFEKGAPFIFPTIKDLREIGGLKMPPVGQAGLMPLALRQREIMQRRLKEKGKEMGKWCFSMGPAEVTGLLLGYDKFYLALYDDPKRISKLLEIVTALIISWLRKQEIEYGGMEVLCLGEHVPHQVNPEQMKEFILPCLKIIYSAFPKAVKIYHNEGFHSRQHIPLVLEFAADIWHFGSDVHSIEDFYISNSRSNHSLWRRQSPWSHASRVSAAGMGGNPGSCGSGQRAQIALVHGHGNDPGSHPGKPASHGAGGVGGRTKK